MVIPFLRPLKNPRLSNVWRFCGLLYSNQRGGTEHHRIQIFRLFLTNSGQGLKFMHERKVAHRYVLGMIFFQEEVHADGCFRDCTVNNIMLDRSRMYPEGYHPIRLNRSQDFKRRAKRHTRTERPPRYYCNRLWLVSSVPLTRCIGRDITWGRAGT